MPQDAVAPTERVVLITGGGSGIGQATAMAFAQQGDQVVVVDRDPSGGQATVDQIHAAGGRALLLVADVTRSDQVAGMVAETVARLGRLDCAFNNAGIPSGGASLIDLTEETWDHMMATNLKSVWLCLKYELPQMLAQGWGAIVNTSSIAGLGGLRNRGDYVVAKHGVIGLTRTAALEVAAQGVRVNAICPGYVRTPMVERVIRREPAHEARMIAAEPIGRLGTPAEVAAAVVWLCSDAASFVTGLAMPIDGAFTAQ